MARALACLIACSCAAETHARPPPTTLSLPAPTPVPDIPPASSEAMAAPATPSRFETRRIGTRDLDETHHAARHHGARIDLDVKGADLHDVFRLLADVGHVSIVLDGNVTGTITLRLKRVPWDEALEVIVRSKGLSLERRGDMIVVRSGS